VIAARRHLLLGTLALVAGCDKLALPGAKTPFQATDITGADFGAACRCPT
jgi:hypothetical protein